MFLHCKSAFLREEGGVKKSLSIVIDFKLGRLQCQRLKYVVWPLDKAEGLGYSFLCLRLARARPSVHYEINDDWLK